MAQDTTLLTLAEAAQRLDVSPETVRRWSHAGKLPVVRLPSGRMRVRAHVVDAILAGEPMAAAS